jgi:uncharacterized membrane protein
MAMTIKIMPRRFLSLHPSITWPRLILTALILVNCIYFGTYASQRHLAFETGAFDTGVYTQPLWNYTQGNNFSISLTKDNGSLRWATHIEPILYLIVPLYARWPDPRTLYWLQVTALSLAALPLYALAARRLQSDWVALAIVLAYFLMPATQSVTLFDFHAVALAPFLLLSAIYFLDRALAAQDESFWLWPKLSREARKQGGGRENSSFPLPPRTPTRLHRLIQTFTDPDTRVLYTLSGLFFLLALSTKEDISLHVFMIGMYLLVLRYRWWEGGVLTVIGLAWFYVAFQIVIPTFRTGGGHSIYVSWFETLGSTPLEIALSPLTTPDEVLAFIFRSDNLPALAMITVPMALLPWAGLPVFILTIPSLAFSLLSQNPTLRQFETWHYAAPMLAFIALSTIDGLARLSYYASVFGLKISGYRFKVPHSTLIILTTLLLTTSFIYHYFRGYTPLSQLYEWPDVTAHHELGREIAATIPPKTSVLAQAQLVPYVAHRQDLTVWSGPLNTDFDYIWLDLSHRKLPNRSNAHGDLLIGLIIETTFGIVVNTDGYIVLKNGANRDVISEELFTFTEFEQPPADVWPFSATFGDTLKLIAVEPEVRRLATSETEPQVVLYFDTLQPPAEDYYLFLYLLEPDGTIVGATEYPQPGLFWWPTSRWQAGDRRQIRVNTIPWWTGDKTIFGYAIGLSRTDDPWDVAARLPVALTDPTLNPPGSQPLDNNTLLPIAAFRRFAGLPYPKPLTMLPGVDPNRLGSK